MKGYTISILMLATAAALANANTEAGANLDESVAFSSLSPQAEKANDSGASRLFGSEPNVAVPPVSFPNVQCQGDDAECAQSGSGKAQGASTSPIASPNTQCQGDDAECAQSNGNKVRVANSIPLTDRIPIIDRVQDTRGFGASLASIINRIIGQSSSSEPSSEEEDEDPRYNIIVQNTPIIEMIYNYMSPADVVESSAEAAVAATAEVSENADDISANAYPSSMLLVPPRTVTVTVTVAAATTPEEAVASSADVSGALDSAGGEGTSFDLGSSAERESLSEIADIESSDFDSFVESEDESPVEEDSSSSESVGDTATAGFRNIEKAGIVAEPEEERVSEFDYASWSSRIDAAAHKLAGNVGGMIAGMITQLPVAADATQAVDVEGIETTRVFRFF